MYLLEIFFIPDLKLKVGRYLGSEDRLLPGPHYTVPLLTLARGPNSLVSFGFLHLCLRFWTDTHTTMAAQDKDT